MTEPQAFRAGDHFDGSLWVISENFIEDEELRHLHTSILNGLRQENPEADVLEMLLMERVATIFVYMRNREATSNIGSQEYKTLTQLWVSMAADLRKTRTQASDLNSVRDEVVTQLLDVIEKAIEGLDLDTQGIFRQRLQVGMLSIGAG